jgi:CRISPR system Cascade subunit CasC
MKLIELHILQSYPVSCLNRDDVGAPKSAVFGGANRARVSSQCLKRAIRQHIGWYLNKELFNGVRTRRLAESVRDVLVEDHNLPEERALEMACALAGTLNKKDGAALPTKDPKMETLFFTSPAQNKALAKLAVEEWDEKKEIKADKKKVVKAVKEATGMDGADVSLFGRMVAADSSLTVEGAAMFSHAISTHKTDNDIDFFSAVGEYKDEDKTDSGADHIGTLEFTSAVYYRYSAVNLDLLADNDHLGGLGLDQRKAVIDASIRATLMAVPGARHNSMNANTLPSYALGIYKDRGQPIQLVNAFEKPVRSANGIADESWERMKEHHGQLKETWDIETETEVVLPDDGLKKFCADLTKHVI